MINFFRYLYYGFYSYFEKRGKKVDKINASVYTGASRIIVYVVIFLFFHDKGIVKINDYNKFYYLICYAILESFITYYLIGRDKHNTIKDAFHKLTIKKQILYERLGVVLTPIIVLLTFIIMLWWIRG